MTQLQVDIPQISFARYLELLKRRRWQVVPVTLLGLFIGGIVAFFIPRYYVAKTAFTYYGKLVENEPTSRTNDDPMQPIVNRAVLSIPETVEETLEQVDWPEAHLEDPVEQRAYANAVRSRVWVTDLDGPSPGRKFVTFEVSYRDTDGLRSAEFVNKLVKVWIKKQRDRIIADANRNVLDANEAVEKAELQLAEARRELTTHIVESGVSPEQVGFTRTELERTRAQGLSEWQTDLDQAEDVAIALRNRRDEIKRQLEDGSVPKTTKQMVVLPPNPVLQAKMAAILPQYQRALQMMAAYKDWTTAHQQAKATVEQLQPTIDEYNAQQGTQEIEVSNEAYGRLQSELRMVENDLEGNAALQERLKGRIAVLNKEIAALPEIWDQLVNFMDLVDRAKRDRDAADLQHSEAIAKFKEIERGGVIEITREAWVPEAPTEPNITLVAIAGMAIGLGLAIGLILALDVLRQTFKTVNDVERALPVPVLGSLDHLETYEDKVKAVSTRRRVSLVAGAFAVLSVSIVTIYYVAPTRLPSVVFRALDMLLGAAN